MRYSGDMPNWDQRESTLPVGLILALAIYPVYGGELKNAKACTALVDDNARLSCYDASLGAATRPSTPAAGAAAAEDQAAFADEDRLHPRVKPNVPKSMTAQLTQAQPLAGGLYRLILNNGQVWNTTQADSSLAFTDNDAVVISRLLLGGYEISRAGHTTSVSAVRVK